VVVAVILGKNIFNDLTMIHPKAQLKIQQAYEYGRWWREREEGTTVSSWTLVVDRVRLPFLKSYRDHHHYYFSTVDPNLKFLLLSGEKMAMMIQRKVLRSHRRRIHLKKRKMGRPVHQRRDSQSSVA